jgi:hypothetical protein
VRPAVKGDERPTRKASDRQQERAKHSRDAVSQRGGMRAREPDSERVPPPPLKGGEHAEREMFHPPREAAGVLLAPIANGGQVLARVPTLVHMRATRASTSEHAALESHPSGMLPVSRELWQDGP